MLFRESQTKPLPLFRVIDFDAPFWAVPWAPEGACSRSDPRAHGDTSPRRRSKSPRRTSPARMSPLASHNPLEARLVIQVSASCMHAKGIGRNHAPTLCLNMRIHHCWNNLPLNSSLRGLLDQTTFALHRSKCCSIDRAACDIVVYGTQLGQM